MFETQLPVDGLCHLQVQEPELILEDFVVQFREDELNPGKKINKIKIKNR